MRNAAEAVSQRRSPQRAAAAGGLLHSRQVEQREGAQDLLHAPQSSLSLQGRFRMPSGWPRYESLTPSYDYIITTPIIDTPPFRKKNIPLSI